MCLAHSRCLRNKPWQVLLPSLFGWEPSSEKRNQGNEEDTDTKYMLGFSNCGSWDKSRPLLFLLFIKLFWNTVVPVCLCIPRLFTHYDHQLPERLVLQNLKYLLYGTWQKEFISPWLAALLYTFHLIKFHSYPVKWEIISLTRCRSSDPERYLPQVLWLIRSRAQIWILIYQALNLMIFLLLTVR